MSLKVHIGLMQQRQTYRQGKRKLSYSWPHTLISFLTMDLLDELLHFYGL